MLKTLLFYVLYNEQQPGWVWLAKKAIAKPADQNSHSFPFLPIISNTLLYTTKVSPEEEMATILT
jgi:hypothetical protein